MALASSGVASHRFEICSESLRCWLLLVGIGDCIIGSRLRGIACGATIDDERICLIAPFPGDAATTVWMSKGGRSVGHLR